VHNNVPPREADSTTQVGSAQYLTWPRDRGLLAIIGAKNARYHPVNPPTKRRQGDKVAPDAPGHARFARREPGGWASGDSAEWHKTKR